MGTPLYNGRGPEEKEPGGGQFTRFRCEIEPRRETVVVRPVGELDLATVEQLRTELRGLGDVGFEHIVIDLRELTFMDSSGLHLVLETAHRARAGRFQLSLIAGPPAVQRVFEITGLIETLPFVRPGEALHS
jgi:anti-sigma B factor antagonist